MSNIIHHLKLPGDADFREVVDLHEREEMEDLKDTSTGTFAELIRQAIGLYVDDEGYICQEVKANG